MRILVIILWIVSIGLSPSFLVAQSQSITIQISGIRNTEGKLQIAIFENEEQFDEEQTSRVLYFDKGDIINGSKEVQIELEKGIYGITVLDDEDESKDMTYRFGIYPLEGVGFSNYKLTGMSKPDFSDFDFTVTGEAIILKVDMRYF